MAVIALKNAADARMNTRNAIRLNHSTRSRSVISTSLKPSASSRELLFREPAIAAFLAVIPNQVRDSCFVWANPSFEKAHRGYPAAPLLLQRRRRILRQFLLRCVCALHFQLVKQDRRRNNGLRQRAHAVADQRVVAERNHVIPQGPYVQLVEHGSTHEFFMPILGVHAIEQPWQ